MNDKNFSLVEKYIPHGYVQQGRDSRKNFEKRIHHLLEQGKLPSDGWSDLNIELLLKELATMDSNNFPGNCGVGEREARIASNLVARRHYNLGHGIGRSGDIAEVQPKAAGSSLINKLTNSMVLDLIKMAGVQRVESCLVLPVATGMGLVLSMLALREQRPDAKYVIWPRIDQKSCFKSILTAGFQPIIIENLLVNDHLETDLFTIRETIEDKGRQNILCIMTTTSCFAPRAPDKLEDVAKLCKEFEIPHLVNNAYGLQSSKCTHLINQADRVGRVDAFIQSTDKNFLVPVGGSVVASFNKKFIQTLSKVYPGRASGSPILDVFITLLSLGASGYKQLLQSRKEYFAYIYEKLEKLCTSYGEKILECRQNQISIAISLSTLDSKYGTDSHKITEFGSFLFKRFVSGTRVISRFQEKTIGQYHFNGWGSHLKHYPTSYLTVAAGIGITKNDVDVFCERLEKAFKHFRDLSDAISMTEQTSEIVPPMAEIVPPMVKARSEKPPLEDHFSKLYLQPKSPHKRLMHTSSTKSYNSDEDIIREKWPVISKASKSDSNLQKDTSQVSWTPDGMQMKVRRESGERYVVEKYSPSDELSQDFVQHVKLPGELPEDQMSFLIDI